MLNWLKLSTFKRLSNFCRFELNAANVLHSNKKPSFSLFKANGSGWCSLLSRRHNIMYIISFRREKKNGKRNIITLRRLMFIFSSFFSTTWRSPYTPSPCCTTKCPYSCCYFYGKKVFSWWTENRDPTIMPCSVVLKMVT
jgi:hypothetical protein